jgi:hypothetical protein
VQISPDGKSVAVRGPDGKPGIWPLDDGGFRPIPGLESKYHVMGWAPDGASVYVAENQRVVKAAAVSRVNIQTGKMEPWRNFGDAPGTGGSPVGAPHLSSDGSAYAYGYERVLSEAYVVTGLR